MTNSGKWGCGRGPGPGAHIYLYLYSFMMIAEGMKWRKSWKKCGTGQAGRAIDFITHFAICIKLK